MEQQLIVFYPYCRYPPPNTPIAMPGIWHRNFFGCTKTNGDRVQTLIENIAECLVAVKQLTGVDEFVARIGQGGSKSQRFFQRLKN